MVDKFMFWASVFCVVTNIIFAVIHAIQYDGRGTLLASLRLVAFSLFAVASWVEWHK